MYGAKGEIEMGTKPNVYPPGSAIIMTSGEYADFCIDAVLVTIKECDMPALVREFCETAPEDYEGAERVDATAFSSWLVAQGHCCPAMTRKRCTVVIIIRLIAI